MKRSLFISLAVLASACGKTVFSGERFACSTSGDCADGFSCGGGECRRAGGEDAAVDVDAGTVDAGNDAGLADAGRDAGQPDAGASDGGLVAGTTCPNNAACLTGLTCVDGVCCRSACSAACDSCNQVGLEGTCLPRPAGSSAPACNGYACDGTATGCASTCSGVNGCNPGFTCVAPTCGRCWSAVTDDFASGGGWSLGGATVAGGHLVVAVMSRNGQPTTTTATSVDTLPLSGCGVTFELAVAPSVVAGYVGRAELRADTGAQRPSFAWQFDTRGLLASWRFSDGGVGEQVLVPAGTAPPRWLRLEESGGQVRWRSTNTTTFITLHTLSNGEPLTGMKLEFSGFFPAQPGNDRTGFEIDALNLGP